MRMFVGKIQLGLAGGVISLLATMHGAAADWQYAHWGASPSEVAASSKGTTKPYDNPAKSSATAKAKLVATYQSGKFVFTVYFYFDENDKLTNVNLELNDPNQCPDLVFALSKTYGAPEDAGSFGVRRWWDAASRNVVIYSEITGCNVRYTEYTAPGQAGGL